MGKHRSRLQILETILSVINDNEGAKKTQIMFVIIRIVLGLHRKDRIFWIDLVNIIDLIRLLRRSWIMLKIKNWF